MALSRAETQRHFRATTDKQRVEVYLSRDTVAALDALPGSRAEAIATLVGKVTTGRRSAAELIADTPPGGRSFAIGPRDTVSVRVTARGQHTFALNGRRIARSKVDALLADA